MIFFFDSDSYASRLMFYDLKTLENVVETSSIYDIKIPILRWLNKLHVSLELNRLVELPFKRIWGSYSLLEKYKNVSGEKIAVFTNVSIGKISLDYLRELQTDYGFKVVLVGVDSCLDNKLSPLIFTSKFKFDLLYTFDEADSLNYGFRFTNTLYSKREDIVPSAVQSDLFFIGRAKDRLQKLQSIASQCVRDSIKPNFSILINNTDQQPINGVKYIDKVVPYDQVLPQILSSKCLLDIVQEGQDGLTMRVYEAIFYNKKLITNNKSVKKLKYYNPEYIQVVDSLDEINVRWIDEGGFVDYHYQGDYSPIHLIEQIQNDLYQV